MLQHIPFDHSSALGILISGNQKVPDLVSREQNLERIFWAHGEHLWEGGAVVKQYLEPSSLQRETLS
jgi:hypothetical protein